MYYSAALGFNDLKRFKHLLGASAKILTYSDYFGGHVFLFMFCLGTKCRAARKDKLKFDLTLVFQAFYLNMQNVSDDLLGTAEENMHGAVLFC